MHGFCVRTEGAQVKMNNECESNYFIEMGKEEFKIFTHVTTHALIEYRD